MSAPPIAPSRVLPTLNEDGSRRRIRPQLYKGPLHTKRWFVAWGLILLFVGLPFIEWGGKPLVLLDVAARQFTLFGRTFFATDGVLLMFLLLGIFVGIIWLTALVGRAFCGWGCPQTVYMEFLFRPIERLFEGNRNSQLKLDQRGGGLRRVLKNIVFALVSVLVANVFLSYFVGVKTLGSWILSSPWEQPAGFLVMGTTAALVFFDFAYFREQMCTVICPYARLQAALLDKNSLIIGYDAQRGEPRKKGKPVPGGGDCIDCNACVVTCPTGIDIRDGLQLECIACGQCVDACNTIMTKINKPKGLIRYTSQASLEGKKAAILRPRVVGYGIVMCALFALLIFIGGARQSADITILRGIGAPFVMQARGVQNQLRLKVENHAQDAGTYWVEVLFRRGADWISAEQAEAQVILPENPLEVAALDRRTTSFFILSAPEAFQEGRQDVLIRVTDAEKAQREFPFTLLGPEGSRQPGTESSPPAHREETHP